VKRRTFFRTVLAGSMLAALFSLRAAADRPVASVSDSTIASGVSVEGVDLSGMTPDQAKDALQAKADSLASTPVTLRYGSSLICATLADFGYTCTNLDIVDSLVPIGKSGNIVERYKEQKDLENNRVDYPLSFSVDFRRVKDFVSTCSAYNCDPVEGQLLIGEDGLPYVEGGTKGMSLKTEESARAVSQAIENWTGGNLTVDLLYDEISPDVTYETLSLVKDVLGTATTDYSASSGNRAVNVENGCSLINGTLLWPGEEFSVTQAVTPFSAENG
jgi:vancomycin resistance protein YoaR